MKLTNLPALRTEDFKGQEEWTPRLFGILNPFFQSLNQVLDANIDYLDNIKSVTREYDLDVIIFQPFNFTWPYPTFIPKELNIIKAAKDSVSTILVAAWSYSATDSIISVDKILELTESGVQAMSGKYKLTVRVTI